MIAWRADDGYEPGVSEIPKFSIKMMQKDTDLSEGIVSGMDYFWYDAPGDRQDQRLDWRDI
jgi:hypothetical protein